MFELSKAKVKVESLFSKIGTLDFNAILDKTLKNVVQEYCKRIEDKEWYANSQEFFNVWEPAKVFLNPDKNKPDSIDLWVEGHLKAAKLKDNETRYSECLPGHDLGVLYFLFDLAGEAYILNWEMNYCHEYYAESLETDDSQALLEGDGDDLPELRKALVDLLVFNEKLVEYVRSHSDNEAASVKDAVMEFLDNPPKYDFRKDFDKLVGMKKDGESEVLDASVELRRREKYEAYVGTWISNFRKSYSEQMTRLFG